MKTVTTPTLHLNGSSGPALSEQIGGAMDALRKTRIAMEHAVPNARDYYVQGDDAFKAARKEHGARMAVVDALIKEYEQIYDSIHDQIDARRARRVTPAADGVD